jgi:hypothetical protein
MPEHKIHGDRVDELIRWHMPRTPVRPPGRLHAPAPSGQLRPLLGLVAKPPTPDGGPGWAVPSAMAGHSEPLAALDARTLEER